MISQYKYPSFDPRDLIGSLPEGLRESLYAHQTVSVQHAIETNVDGINCKEWACPDHCHPIDMCCLPAQVKEVPSDRRDSERRDYVYGTITIDIPHGNDVLGITEAMRVLWEERVYKIISVTNDLDVATRLRCSWRVE